jgi:hypothetical protein
MLFNQDSLSSMAENSLAAVEPGATTSNVSGLLPEK